MQKFLITPRSHNRVTGPIMVTTSPRKTCPNACPLRETANDQRSGGCYAEHGFLGGFIWGKLDKLQPGQSFKADQIVVRDLDYLLATIRDLPEGTLWRHNQAGDLWSDDQQTISAAPLNAIVRANKGRHGFTYTHYDVINSLANRKLVADANRQGFTVNLSANDIDHADRLADTESGPVAVILPGGERENFRTPKGRNVIICPARLRSDITCATCGICAKPRKAIVGLPAIGKGADRVSPTPQRRALKSKQRTASRARTRNRAVETAMHL